MAGNLAAAWSNLGYAMKMVWDLPNAKAVFERALSLDEEFQAARIGLQKVEEMMKTVQVDRTPGPPHLHPRVTITVEADDPE
jgi:hypothetical protein